MQSGKVAQAYNPSTWEGERQDDLKFKINLSYIFQANLHYRVKSSQKKKKQKTKKQKNKKQPVIKYKGSLKVGVIRLDFSRFLFGLFINRCQLALKRFFF